MVEDHMTTDSLKENVTKDIIAENVLALSIAQKKYSQSKSTVIGIHVTLSRMKKVY